MRLVFLKFNKPRQFSYKPRYFDPQKEEQEERQRRVGAGESGEEAFREKIRTKWQGDSDSSRRRKARSGMLIYILIVLMLLYIIFFT